VEKTEKEPAKLHPWQRKSDETGIQYKAFQVYLKLGASRSLRKAAQKHKKGSGHYGRWASTHNWVERAKAYDLWVAAKTEPLRIKEVQKRAAEAESELTKELRAEYELLDLGKTLAQEMIQVGRAALRFPLHEETRTTTELDKGKTIVITNTVTATDISKHALAGNLAEKGLVLALKMSREKIAKLVGTLTPDQTTQSHGGQEGLRPDQIEAVKQKLDSSLEGYKARIAEYQMTPPPIPSIRPAP
jgi:hypothetical protein